MKTSTRQTSLCDSFTAFLRGSRHRCTRERELVARAAESCGSHFSADDVIGALTARVAAPTVYATLELMCECGLLRRFVVQRTCWHYERTDTETGGAGGRHVHLVCRACGKIKLVADLELARSLAARSWVGFTPDDYTLSIYGTCSTCRRRRAKASTIDNAKKQS